MRYFKKAFMEEKNPIIHYTTMTMLTMGGVGCPSAPPAPPPAPSPQPPALQRPRSTFQRSTTFPPCTT